MTRPRALGLVRVSKERDGMVSPEMQRTAVSDHASRSGYQLVGFVEGPDESGSRASSAWWARLDASVARVEAGEVDVLVAWKWSRFARNRLRWAVALDRVETAGGRIESATEGVDVTTSTGRFTRGMLAELNAFEAERIGEVWREVHGRRIGHGLTHNGRPRFGYTYTDGVHVPDPETAPVLGEAYARYTAGAGFYSVAAWLNRSGWRTTAGGLWTDGTLRRGLDSGFAAGMLLWKGERIRGAHEALLPPGDWQAYLDARARRGRHAPQRERSRYLLSGLVRCGACRGGMNGGEFGKGRTPKYRCETRRATAGIGCTVGYVAVAGVDAAVLGWLGDLAVELDAEAALAKMVDDGQARHEAAARRAGQEVTRLTAALVRLEQRHAEDEDADETVYRAARDDYRARLRAARDAHAVADLAVRTVPPETAQVAGSLVEEWDVLPVAERRDMLSRLLDHVLVWPQGRGVAPKVEPVPVWSV